MQDMELPADVMLPDSRPITGMLLPTLGSFSVERSYVAPSLRLEQTMDSNPGMLPGSDVMAVTKLAGGIELHRVSRTGQSLLQYSGGGFIYATDSNLNSTFQQARLQQLLQFHRWSLTFVDDVSYTPESEFGFGGLAGSIVPSQSPSQSILTAQSQRLSNVFVAQANYVINRRSSITVAGNFGLLRFSGGAIPGLTQLGSNLQDWNQGGGLIGYNYKLSEHNLMGVSYDFNTTRYRAESVAGGFGLGTNFDSHTWQFVYGRKITGHLALQLSGGPQIVVTHGSIAAATAVGLPSTAAGWAAQELLQYRLRRLDLKASYAHMVTAGAGVLRVRILTNSKGVSVCELAAPSAVLSV